MQLRLSQNTSAKINFNSATILHHISFVFVAVKIINQTPSVFTIFCLSASYFRPQGKLLVSQTEPQIQSCLNAHTHPLY